MAEIYVHVTVHRDTLLIIKPTRCINFLKFIHGIKLYMFRTVPLSIIRSYSLYTQHWYMSYRFADSLQTGSGWNPYPACKPSANLYDIYQSCMHSEKLQMIYRGTV
jgi:hypothetical protein